MKGKYCCGFQALCSAWVSAIFTYSDLIFHSHLAIMAARKGTRTAYVVANYFASSDEEQEEVETFEFADFEPFMASFRRL